MRWWTTGAGVLLAVAATADADGVYVCGRGAQREYRDDAHAADCRRSALAPLGGIGGTSAPRGLAPPAAVAAGTARDAARSDIQARLAAERLRMEALRREYNGGEPERRGDERNYARYQARVASLRAALEDSESQAAALERQLER